PACRGGRAASVRAGARSRACRRVMVWSWSASCRFGRRGGGSTIGGKVVVRDVPAGVDAGRVGRGTPMAANPRQRDKVLALVRDSLEPLDAPVIARTLGIHITTARFHLNALIDAGLVEGTWLPSETVGRPRKGYLAVGADPAAPVLAALLAQL